MTSRLALDDIARVYLGTAAEAREIDCKILDGSEPVSGFPVASRLGVR